MERPFITSLRKISNPKGDVFHALKKSEKSFVAFGEAYLTNILPSETKGWKQHLQMTLNLVVVKGDVRFYTLAADGQNVGNFEIGESNYCRLTVPPKHWVAFRNIGTETALVLNVASLEHDPSEAINVALETYQI